MFDWGGGEGEREITDVIKSLRIGACDMQKVEFWKKKKKTQKFKSQIDQTFTNRLKTPDTSKS